MHWWGVSRDAVQHWRRALGVGFSDSEGTVRLMRAAGWKSARAPHAKGLGHRFTPEEAERGSKNGGRARWQHRPGGHLALPKPRPGRKPGQTRGRPADEGRRAEVMRLRGKGLTLAEIGRRLGVTRQAVAIMLARAVADGAEGE